MSNELEYNVSMSFLISHEKFYATEREKVDIPLAREITWVMAIP